MRKVRSCHLIYLLFWLVTLACISQSLRGIDLRGYLDTVQSCANEGFVNPPYPLTRATNGDYFQSPFFTLLLWPFSLTSRLVAKLLFAGFATIFLFVLLGSLEVKRLSKKSQFFLLLLFAHALSDVYVALNPLFLVLGLLWLCHIYSLRHTRFSQSFSGFFLALAILIRVTPALLIPFFLFSPKRRSVLPWTFFFFGFFLVLSYLVLPNADSWWWRWLQSLPLYSQAANVLSPAFQSPLALFSKWLQTSGARAQVVEQLDSILGLGIFGLFGVLAFRAEKLGKSDLAFSLLLVALYCSFSRLWASAFLFCLPLFILFLRQGRTSYFGALSILYALLPQWLYPRDLWNYLMSKWALQGIVIIALIAFCVFSEVKTLYRTPQHS